MIDFSGVRVSNTPAVGSENRELTGTAVFLACDDNTAMTGQCLAVDAGGSKIS